MDRDFDRIRLQPGGLRWRGWSLNRVHRPVLPYEDIESIDLDPDTDARAVTLKLKDGARLALGQSDAEKAQALKAVLDEIVRPAILECGDALPFETIAEECRRLARSYGPNVRKMVDLILRQALLHGASDVHVEERDGRPAVCFRCDGVLFPILEMEPDLGARTVNCIKAAAGLLTYRKDTIQEGRIARDTPDGRQDLRVSVVPCTPGERVSLRMYDKLKGSSTLEELGFATGVVDELHRIAATAQGLFVISGPSGSGKTTTLYALLRHLVKQRGHLTNVLTIEDPIEYRMAGMHQVQVDERAGVTFAGTLRSSLRQDVGAIMLGEIRDAETAHAAVEAALTGHLVLSSLHAGGAAETVTRLLDLAVKPFLLQSALRGVMCQRLVRTLCTQCRERVQVDPAQWSLWNEAETPEIVPDHAWRGGGCHACRGTGYRGRTVMAEYMKNRDAIGGLIKASSDTRTLERAGIDQGMVPLNQQGLRLILDAQTDLQEVRRVLA